MNEMGVEGEDGRGVFPEQNRAIYRVCLGNHILSTQFSRKDILDRDFFLHTVEVQ